MSTLRTMGVLVAGRRLKNLPDDGSARTQLAQRLRMLKERAGDPTYEEIGKRTGYSRTALSGLFNGQLPSRELLRDVVQGLGGNPEQYLRLLDQAQSETEPNPGPAEDLQQARDEIAALKLAIANPDSVAYWAGRKMTAAKDEAAKAARLQSEVLEILTRAQGEIRHLFDRQKDTEQKCDEMIRNATTQATLTEEHAQVVATGTIRGAEATAVRMVEAARDVADRINSDARMHASSLHTRAGEQVDALLREADAVAADARREADRLKARARIEIQRMVRETQDALNRVGHPQSAQMLEQLLTDFAIGDVHPEDGQTGRHRRRAIPSPSARPELTA
ncbi:helix-turn-helix domain-containing protein [Streptomyces sp. NPDC019443]|uniref:helix-turn-helix domain-containing protein n=1 Tax=Streptomyces sp. NPDC019443 TaxID=3365061 RepID=UPI0037939D0A